MRRKRKTLCIFINTAVLLASVLSISCTGESALSQQNPGILELQPAKAQEHRIELHTASSTVIVFSFTDQFRPESLTPAPELTTEADWNINGSPPENLYRYSRAADELPKTKDGRYPVETQHWFYLKLNTPLETGSSYTVQGPYGEAVLNFDDTATFCESIKVNQVGYHPDSAQRYANLGVFLGSGGSEHFEDLPEYRVRNRDTEQIVFQGAARYRGDDTDLGTEAVTSGEYVYRLDLSSVPPGGPYQVEVAGFGVSYPFSISYEAVSEIAEVYSRGLYHQRCGIELASAYTDYTRSTCHSVAADTRTPWSSNGKIETSRKDPQITLSGGYHDAGDFDRRPQHTIIPILMLNYYEAFPENFRDAQYRIPESGNSLPDFLDEALWGVSLWEQLMIEDPLDPEYGGIRAGTETNAHPEYGKATADSDLLNYGTWAVSSEVTGYGAGMMAQAARLLLSFPNYEDRAQELYWKARIAWSYLEKRGDVDGKTLNNSARTEILYSALQLYLASLQFKQPGRISEIFHTAFKETADKILIQGGSWPQQYLPGNIYASCTTSHFFSYMLTGEEVDETLKKNLQAIIRNQAHKGGYMGYDSATAFYPQGVSKGYGWGAATAQGRYADVLIFAYRIAETPEQRESLFADIAALGDYALGLNPLGVSFVTGLGSQQVNSPLHLDSFPTKFGTAVRTNTDHTGEPIGNVPGILIFGPSEERSSQDYQKAVSDTLYPPWEELPLQRRWADGWSLVNNNEFSVWETLVWNTCLYGFLHARPVF